MKKTKIIYWVFTAIIVLLDGVMPALTSNSEIARQGITHLGYPDYFRVMLTLFKVIGALVLIMPFFKKQDKGMGLCRLRFYLRQCICFKRSCRWL